MISWLKNIRTKADWKALAFCVFAAFTFWFLNAMNHDFTVDIYYPLEIRYDESNLVPLAPLPEKIKLNVRGYGWHLLRKYLGVKTRPVTYEPDYLPARKYITSNELSSILSRQLSDVEFNYLVRDTLFFEFDYIREKKVRVIIDSASIALSPSYQITTPIVLSPDSIIYRGPASYLQKIPDSIKIAINHIDIKEDFEQQIRIPEKGYSKVKMLNKEIKVRFDVSEFEKQSTLVPVQILNFPEDSSMVLIDKNIILTYFVMEEDKNKIGPNDFLAYLDFKDLDKTDSTIGPALHKKPAFIKNYYFSPYAVKVTRTR